MGRPNGKPNYDLNLYPVYEVLKEYYKDKIMFINEPLIDERIEKINKLKNTIILLDNLRFYPEEEGKYINT